MRTWHIHVQGQVQGVGFRPFVFLVAQEYGLKGWVNNAVDGVHIVFNAEKKLALAFAEKIVADAPILSRITTIHREELPQKFFADFRIIHSEASGEANLLLTPDGSLCPDCRAELHQEDNSRYRYPFITCTNCGPRFSIVHRLPYDREHTKMDAFQMCPSCIREYENPRDRRYYSQTNSCPDCGIELSLYSADRKVITRDSQEAMDRVVAAWNAGDIIAIKGIGGYLLTCDAANATTVSKLRRRKHRPSKPLALMYPSVDALKEMRCTQAEMDELESIAAPIVLLEKNKNSIPEIAPNLDRVGVLLPYTPLYELLLKKFGKPIVATSGNVSKAPIIYEDAKALNDLLGIADVVLANNRAIVAPQDDSVVLFSFFTQQKIILRRSRGLAPTYINQKLLWPNQSILATGAMLKSSFSLLHRKNVYLSQYLGDLAHFDAIRNYEHTVQHFLQLFTARPEVILSDEHPEYPSTQYAVERSENWGIPLQKIQHHRAHFGAILGEHDLADSEEAILGVIWDGTGLGSDAQIWGGEFFKYKNYDFSRCAHFEYFNFILGDKMPKEPRISAFAACWSIDGATAFLKEKFTPTEWQIYNHLLAKEPRLQTSSVGRLFDAVAALLGIMDKQSYEGEAAMQLEVMATKYFKQNGFTEIGPYLEQVTFSKSIPTQQLLTELIKDLQNGVAKEFIAAKFHYTLVQIIKVVADQLKIKKIAFSGGVFQNGLLVDLLNQYLRVEFQLYFHQALSPNDENISFGQLVCYQISQQKKLFINRKLNKYVFSDSR